MSEQLARHLFDLCRINEAMVGKLNISPIEYDDFSHANVPWFRSGFRVYYDVTHCWELIREQKIVAGTPDGHHYLFKNMEEEGYKPCTIEEAHKIFLAEVGSH